MRSSRWIAVLAMLCAAITGCTVVLAPSRRQGGTGTDAAGIDAGPTPDGNVPDGGPHDGGGIDGGGIDGGGIDGGVDSGSDAGPVCPTGLSCAAAAPGGWNGPVILVTGGGADTLACPSDAPSSAFTGFSGLTFDPADCSCTCNAPVGTLSCGTSQLMQTNSTCITLGTSYATFSNGQCRTVGTLSATGGWQMTTPTFIPGSATCSPSSSTDAAPFTWDASYRGCGFGTPASCGASAVCVPELDSGERLCVWIDGDASCPTAFPAQVAIAGDAADTRSCTACSCGAVAGTCAAEIAITNGCPGTIYHDGVTNTGCTAAHSVSGLSATATLTPSGSCSPSGGAPTGSVTPMAPRTVCCVE